MLVVSLDEKFTDLQQSVLEQVTNVEITCNYTIRILQLNSYEKCTLPDCPSWIFSVSIIFQAHH